MAKLRHLLFRKELPNWEREQFDMQFENGELRVKHADAKEWVWINQWETIQQALVEATKKRR